MLRTYTVPFVGFDAVQPQFAPPCAPGIETVSLSDGGVKSPSFFALPIRTLEFVCGRTEREVRDRPLLVDGELAPRVHAADVLPRILRPRLVSEFTGMWNRVKLPHKLACDDVERPQIAGGRHVVLTRCRTKNDQVFEHLPRV